MTGRVFEIVHRGARPLTTNAERQLHRMERARIVSDWRADAAWLARAARIPRLEQITVTAVPQASDGRSRADVGACLPAVKASIDGLVDARVLADDDDSHVLELTFLPVVIAGWDGLVLRITEVVPEVAS